MWACIYTGIVNFRGPARALLARAAAELRARFLGGHSREARAHAHLHSRAGEGERAAE